MTLWRMENFPPSPGSTPSWYPVLLDLRGRECLVVGGGAIGARKAEALLTAGARVTLVSKVVGEEVARLLAVREIEIITRAYESTDLDNKWFVVTAIDEPEVTAQIKRDADDRRVWMNAADDPPNCSVILPAVHRDGEVIVTVSTAGASPATAAWLRDSFAEQFGDLPGRLAREVRDVRERVRTFRSSEGLPWQTLVESLAAELSLNDGSAEPRVVNDLVNEWLIANCRSDICASCSTHCQAVRRR
jgi:precorrin-2 dehydrogenase / sirohydrochlorin ferrochelatase